MKILKKICYIFFIILILTSTVVFAQDEIEDEFAQNIKLILLKYKEQLNFENIEIGQTHLKIIQDKQKGVEYLYTYKQTDDGIIFAYDVNDDYYGIFNLIYLYAIYSSDENNFARNLTYILATLKTNDNLANLELNIDTIAQNMENIYKNEEINILDDQNYQGSYQLVFDRKNEKAYMIIKNANIEDISSRLYMALKNKDIIFKNKNPKLEENESSLFETQIKEPQISDFSHLITLFSLLFISILIYFVIILKNMKKVDINNI